MHHFGAPQIPAIERRLRKRLLNRASDRRSCALCLMPLTSSAIDFPAPTRLALNVDANLHRIRE